MQIRDITRANFQQAVDFGVRKIVEQGGPSADYGGGCMYRDPDTGRRCLIGHMIPDELYDPSLEGQTYGDIEQVVGGIFEVRYLLRDLQLCHDESVPANYSAGPTTDEIFMDTFKRNVERFCEKERLTVPEVLK